MNWTDTEAKLRLGQVFSSAKKDPQAIYQRGGPFTVGISYKQFLQFKTKKN